MKKALFFISVITFLSTTGQSITNKEFWENRTKLVTVLEFLQLVLLRMHIYQFIKNIETSANSKRD